MNKKKPEYSSPYRDIGMNAHTLTYFKKPKRKPVLNDELPSTKEIDKPMRGFKKTKYNPWKTPSADRRYK